MLYNDVFLFYMLYITFSLRFFSSKKTSLGVLSTLWILGILWYTLNLIFDFISAGFLKRKEKLKKSVKKWRYLARMVLTSFATLAFYVR